MVVPPVKAEFIKEETVTRDPVEEDPTHWIPDLKF